VSRTLTAPPTDPRMWRQLLATVHPDRGSLDRLIEARAQEVEGLERIEASWVESARKHNLRAQAVLRQEWAAHFRRMIGVHEQLAEHNRRRLAQLMDRGMYSS
jgi:hypothetical protein